MIPPIRFCLIRRCLIAAATIAFIVPGISEAQPAAHGRARHRVHHRLRAARPAPTPVYGTTYSPGPDCRYADGTPFDPDIIGGPNHVGDGGPAVNLGGFPPCGF